MATCLNKDDIKYLSCRLNGFLSSMLTSGEVERSDFNIIILKEFNNGRNTSSHNVETLNYINNQVKNTNNEQQGKDKSVLEKHFYISTYCDVIIKLQKILVTFSSEEINIFLENLYGSLNIIDKLSYNPLEKMEVDAKLCEKIPEKLLLKIKANIIY